MDNKQIEVIKKLAGNFREAIERADKDSLPNGLKEFPRGSCSDASLLLARYLTDQRYGPFKIVRADRWNLANNTHTTHAWLEKDGFIIDITADHYAEILDKVIVTNSSDWHKTFVVDEVREADLDKYVNGVVKTDLIGAYNRILLIDQM